MEAAQYMKKISKELNEIVLKNKPKEAIINPEALKQMELIATNFAYIKCNAGNEPMRIGIMDIDDLADGTWGDIHIETESLNIWMPELKNSFVKALSEASVFEIFSVEDKIMMDFTVNNLYIKPEIK
jgi:hypothetical protein